MSAKKRKGSKVAGQYVGLMNAVSAPNKAKAKSIRKRSGVTKAVAFLKKHRKAK